MQNNDTSLEENFSQAWALYKGGDALGARLLCDRVRSIRRDHLPVRRLVAAILLDGGESEAAIHHLELLLTYQPENA